MDRSRSSNTGTSNASLADINPSSWPDRFGDELYNFALNRLQRHELAEEAVQDTFLAGIRTLPDFRREASERTWLYAILKRRICDLLRSQWSRRVKTSLEDEVDPERLLFDDQGGWNLPRLGQQRCPLEMQELREIIFKCLKILPRNLSAVFSLQVLQEKKCREICNELEISETNFRSRLYRARLLLTKCVTERWPE